MSEGNPNGQRENSELSDLLRELELQIDGVNAGLTRIRGTVARITYAANVNAAGAPSAWGGSFTGAPANRGQWQPSAFEAAAAEAASLDSVVPEMPSPVRASSPTPQVEYEAPTPDPESEPSQALWDSVAEGASWPRAHIELPVETPKAEIEWPTVVPSDLASPAEQNATETWTAPALEDVQAIIDFPPVEHVPAPADLQPVEDVQGLELEQPVEAVLPAIEASELPVNVAYAEPEAQQPVPANDASELAAASEPKAEQPSPAAEGKLSSGWPDESAWSQSFEWPAMKSADAQPVTNETSVDSERAAVSDMVARMRAELASSGESATEEAEAPERDFWAKRDAAPPKAAPPSRNGGSDARRDDVSRTVAEIRSQLKAADFETSAEGHGSDDDSDAAVNDYAPQESPAGPVRSEEEMRDEVRRAVEAAREELAGGSESSRIDEKPAFKLAAPGSIPDWSHMQMEPSGPPVVVMKDVDGRVELASVYETLNELGCGDGAALLNYTPHSVTVGLPISAKFPSQEQVAGAVEKVFGLSAKVESDGVRITVSIGENDPKKRSVDAA